MDGSLKKGIFFDLDTEALKNYYPVKSWNNAYADIERFLTKNGFEHTQGSGYHSLNPMSHADVMIVIYELTEKYPWLNKCVNVCTLNDVPAQHDITNVFDKSINLSKRIDNEKELGSMDEYLKEIKMMRSQSINMSENPEKNQNTKKSKESSR